MHKVLLAAFILAAVSAATAFAFNPDELNTISFDNATGTKVEMIFLSPGDSKFWGPDIIGADYILMDGGSISYYVHYPNTSFRFDIMSTDDKGNKFEIRGFELTDGRAARITLTSKSQKAGTPDFRLASVRIENNTGHEILYLFVSPSDSGAWGVDLLDDETTVANGDSHAFVLPVGRDKVTYCLMGVDENNNEYKFDITIDPKTRKEFTWAIEPGDLKKAK
ncbi:MAG: hypothetical protein ABSG38_18465 [Spirochaetia bacterium]|jgi:hypothetical protein